MIAFALGFGVYIWRRWRADVATARLPKEETERGDSPEDSGE